jgi:enoyl-CoA hydratase
MDSYEDILVQMPRPWVLLITLNRPKARNALRNNTLREVAQVLSGAERDKEVRAVVITGGGEIFAAGADIKELSQLDVMGALADVRPHYWKSIACFPKPLLCAVNGYALGAGCEMAMHADIVVAGANAVFGQPEINLGIIPGAGGTQRLPRIVGKALAMKMVLTGLSLDASAAVAAGLVAEVVQPAETIERTLELAEIIASKAPLAACAAKELILKSYEMPLESGLGLERKAFSLLMASADRNEGIAAFLQKRRPEFNGR